MRRIWLLKRWKPAPITVRVGSSPSHVNVVVEAGAKVVTATESRTSHDRLLHVSVSRWATLRLAMRALDVLASREADIEAAESPVAAATSDREVAEALGALWLPPSRPGPRRRCRDLALLLRSAFRR
jgi:hypothetical protein